MFQGPVYELPEESVWCCSVLPCVAVHVAGRVAECCSVLQCSDLRYVAGPGVQVAQGVSQ